MITYNDITFLASDLTSESGNYILNSMISMQIKLSTDDYVENSHVQRLTLTSGHKFLADRCISPRYKLHRVTKLMTDLSLCSVADGNMAM